MVNMIHLKVDSLPDPSNRFDLGEEIATGVWAKVRHIFVKLRKNFIKSRK